jgi:hypothetical protein
LSFSGDAFVLLLLILAISLWGLFALRRWLREKPSIPVPIADRRSRPKGDAVSFLEEQGYEVVHGKVKIPVTVHMDDKLLGSSLYVDYFAKQGEKLFAVKLARSRRPLSPESGSSIREHLLVYALLYEHTAGVLYVDMNKREIHKIRFELEL